METRVHNVETEDSGNTVSYSRANPGFLLLFTLTFHLPPRCALRRTLNSRYIYLFGHPDLWSARPKSRPPLFGMLRVVYRGNTDRFRPQVRLLVDGLVRGLDNQD